MTIELENNLTNIFKLPICYNEKVKKLNENIPLELELYDTIEKEESNKPIYNYVFNPKLTISNSIIRQLGSHYTTDILFLKNTQKLVKHIKTKQIDNIYNNNNMTLIDIENTIQLWNEIKNDTGFCEKYLYIDWNFAKFLNNNASFLQIMSLYNIASPLLSLCLPIFILIIPFFIIKLRGIELNMSEYITVLKTILAQQAIVKIFTSFNNVDFNQKIYLLISASFYVFSIYQNLLVCIRFYSNMKKIHDYLFKFKQYISFTIEIMKYYLSKSSKLTKYIDFNNELTKNMNNLEIFYNNISCISDFKLSIKKITEIGHIMQTFYSLYEDPIYHNSLIYSFGFNGYVNILYGLKTNIDNKVMNKALYCKDISKPKFKKIYYPKFMYLNTNVTNNCNLSKNMIITGPNASGKTTFLKSIIINILLTQQVGYGCFRSAKLTPFQHIHCYLNIPDTSGRDSLFQAEARRCKNILDLIDNPTIDEETHFCMFDELYSGTNPDEAISSAYAFIDYITKNKNICCLITSHYLKLCEKLNLSKNIENYNMLTIQDKKTNDFTYTYILNKGISNVKGGIKVLKDMNYPIEILNKTKISE